MNPDGSDVLQLTHNDYGTTSEDPVWGKNGWIYFDGGPVDGLPHLYRMNANGRAVLQITQGDGGECCVAPSPDGHLLAFDGFFPAVAADGAQGIYVTDLHGGSYPDFRRLTSASPTGFDTAPDISPDGRTIAFRRVVDETAAAVFVIGVDGRGLRQVTPYALEAGPPRWSPDGRRIVFNSGTLTDFDDGQIWVANADGTGLTQLTHGAPDNPSFQPSWSADGSEIVFAHFLPTGFFTQLRVMNADGSDEHVISQGADFTLDVRPDWGDARGNG
jgi:Tol biopolymer transport system component